MIQVLKSMIVREIQEHKVAFVYAPFFVSIILSTLIMTIYDITGIGFNVTDFLTIR